MALIKKKAYKGFEGEYWRELDDLYDNYAISNLGNILNIKKGKLLCTRINRYGYEDVHLSTNGVSKRFTIHRLMAKAFIDNIDNKKYINHKNGDKKDNSINNLEWCTASENTIHALKNQLMKRVVGTNHGMSKLKGVDVRRIKMALKCGIQGKELSEMFGVSTATISNIKRRVNWGHIKLNLV